MLQEHVSYHHARKVFSDTGGPSRDSRTEMERECIPMTSFRP